MRGGSFAVRALELKKQHAFAAKEKPANHIPTAPTAQCTACDTSTDFSVMPTLANIHANAPSTSGNCAQCHAASVVAGFAIPSANFAIVGPPSNHVPTSAACESCHVGAGSSVAATPVGNGAKFSGSRIRIHGDLKLSQDAALATRLAAAGRRTMTQQPSLAETGSLISQLLRGGD